MECKTTKKNGLTYHAHAEFCEHLFPGESESLREAYKAGQDKAQNGVNTTNSNFRHFSSKTRMKAWELGVKSKEN